MRPPKTELPLLARTRSARTRVSRLLFEDERTRLPGVGQLSLAFLALLSLGPRRAASWRGDRRERAMATAPPESGFVYLDAHPRFQGVAGAWVTCYNCMRLRSTPKFKARNLNRMSRTRRLREGRCN